MSDEISIKPADTVIPLISFDDSGYLQNRGTLHFSKSKPKQTLSFDVERIPEATGVMFEITRPETYFADHNCKELDHGLLKTVTKAVSHGKLELDVQDFSSACIYQLRGRAIDKYGKPIGLAGDHIVISANAK